MTITKLKRSEVTLKKKYTQLFIIDTKGPEGIFYYASDSNGANFQ